MDLSLFSAAAAAAALSRRQPVLRIHSSLRLIFVETLDRNRPRRWSRTADSVHVTLAIVRQSSGVVSAAAAVATGNARGVSILVGADVGLLRLPQYLSAPFRFTPTSASVGLLAIQQSP